MPKVTISRIQTLFGITYHPGEIEVTDVQLAHLRARNSHRPGLIVEPSPVARPESTPIESTPEADATAVENDQ